jgi:hypothetical protein
MSENGLVLTLFLLLQVSGNDHNSYYHEMFVRDCPQMCLKMKRIKKSELKKKGEDTDEADEMEEEDEVSQTSKSDQASSLPTDMVAAMNDASKNQQLAGHVQAGVEDLSSNAAPTTNLAGVGTGGGAGIGLAGNMPNLQGILNQTQGMNQGTGMNPVNLQGLLGQVQSLQGLAGQPGSLQGLASSQPGMLQGLASQPGMLQGLASQPGMLQGFAGQPGTLQGFAGQPGMLQGLASQPGMLQGLASQPGMLQGLASQPGMLQGLPQALQNNGSLPPGFQGFGAGQLSGFQNVAGQLLASSSPASQAPAAPAANNQAQNNESAGTLGPAPATTQPSAMMPPLPGMLPSSTGGLPQVDSATLMKLQAALTAATGTGMSTQQQPQPTQVQGNDEKATLAPNPQIPSQTLNPQSHLGAGLSGNGNGNNYGFQSLGGHNAALLAAQLQAAVRKPPQAPEGDKKAEGGDRKE